MSRSGEIRLQFGLDERTFRIGIKQWERLDAELEVGPSVLAARLSMGQSQAQQVLQFFPLLATELGRFRQNEPRLVLYHGLIGGGMAANEAGGLVKSVEEDGGFTALIPTAWDVVWAGFMGVEIEDPAGEQRGASPDRPLSQTDGSGSAETASTPSAPSRGTRRSRSKT